MKWRHRRRRQCTLFVVYIERGKKTEFILSQAAAFFFSFSLLYCVSAADWLTDWLTGLTNWLSTFDCLLQIDLYMWIRYFVAVGSICLLFFDLLSTRRIESIEMFFFECFHFNSIFFYSISIFNICNRIESIQSACTHTNTNRERETNNGASTLTGAGWKRIRKMREWKKREEESNWKREWEQTPQLHCDWTYFDCQFCHTENEREWVLWIRYFIPMSMFH